MLNCDRIDIMLTRAQIFISVLLILIVTGLTVLLILFHGQMTSTVVTIVSSILAQMVAAMITGVGYFLSRNRPHTAADAPGPDSTPQIPTPPAPPAK
jgi:hypothetical protein